MLIHDALGHRFKNNGWIFDKRNKKLKRFLFSKPRWPKQAKIKIKAVCI